MELTEYFKFYFKKNIKTKNFVIKENRHHQVENNEISINFDKINLERELDNYLKIN